MVEEEWAISMGVGVRLRSLARAPTIPFDFRRSLPGSTRLRTACGARTRRRHNATEKIELPLRLEHRVRQTVSADLE